MTNPKNSSGVDLRGHRRIPLKVPIECSSGSTTVTGRTENISLGGVLIRATQTLEWDEPVTASFLLPDGADSLHVRGRIAHVVPGEFMGLEFADLAQAVQERIAHYIGAAPDSK